MLNEEPFTTPTKHSVVAARCLRDKIIVVTARTFFFISAHNKIKASRHTPLPVSDAARILSCIFLADMLVAACIEDKGACFFGLLCLDTQTMIASSPELPGSVHANRTFTAFGMNNIVVFAFLSRAGVLTIWPSKGVFLEPLLFQYKYTAITHIFSSIIALGTTTGQTILVDVNGMKVLRTLEPYQHAAVPSKAADLGLVSRFSMMSMTKHLPRPSLSTIDDPTAESSVDNDDMDISTNNLTYVNASRELFLQSILDPSSYVEESDIFVDELPSKGARNVRHIVHICFSEEINVLASMSSGRVIFYYCLESRAAFPVLFSTYRAACISPGKSGFLVGDDYGTVLHVILGKNRVFKSMSNSIEHSVLRFPPLIKLAGCAHMTTAAVSLLTSSDAVILTGCGRSLSVCSYKFLQDKMKEASADFLRQSLCLAYGPAFISKCFITLNGYITALTSEAAEMHLLAQIEKDLAIVCEEKDPETMDMRTALQATTESINSSLTTSQFSLQTSKYEPQEQKEYGMGSATIFGEQLFERAVKNNLRDLYRLLVAFDVKQPFFSNILIGKDDRLEFIKHMFAFQNTLQENPMDEIVQLKALTNADSELLASTIVRIRSAIWKAYSDIITISYFFGSQLQQIRSMLVSMTKTVKSLGNSIIGAAYQAQLHNIDPDRFDQMVEQIQGHIN
ncbi:hypothetical protein GL50803_0014450 [Giardia duodenalis]|uniref:Uncharacterized protein n=1 Tax=Giardia intestinalis (strain ATCC 50803 / WB clone C6) TaxID=184922 RepID=A8BXB3_GIAIC|nr:hypothetical protein GL50803_0014450 [Giardia intestinalis]KAE8301721.1 hypothetical protein GL50803_0014450 [Giardia intestinalis]|eukprot:XP_001704326.1 Hypothetical protein GL50803_14450 [Giardia lamblia ATCC 50803]